MPKGLSQVVLRCLAKRPEDRFQDYDALAAALEPYASWSPTPATFGRRFAGGRDRLRRPWRRPRATAVVVGNHAVRQARSAGAHRARGRVDGVGHRYYWLCESRWGTTLGKAVLGLTVVDTHGVRPRPGVVLRRVMIFSAPELLLGVVEALVPGMVQLLATPGYGTAISVVGRSPSWRHSSRPRDAAMATPACTTWRAARGS